MITEHSIDTWRGITTFRNVSAGRAAIVNSEPGPTTMRTSVCSVMWLLFCCEFFSRESVAAGIEQPESTNVSVRV